MTKLLLTIATLTGLLISCGDSADALVDGGAAVDVITISPSGQVWLDPDATVQLLATTYDAVGQIVTDCDVTWTSDATVATVSASGLVTAVAAGATSITASCDDHSDEIVVRVYSSAPVDHVTLSHGDVVLGIDETLQLHAQPRDVANQPVNRPVTWQSDAPDVATVDANGVVTTHSDGSALIIATSDGVWATMFVWVDEQLPARERK
jgi:hypothetical protein